MNNRTNYTMLCDFYELSMANGYFQTPLRDCITYFDVFFRTIPDEGGFAITAGLEQVVDYIKNLSTEIGKTPVVVNEAPGFVVNKILIPYCNEGVCVLQEGVASAEDIDIAMQLGCNHPMGPLHLGDLIGWDVVLNIMDVLFNETHDSKYRANVLIRKMVRAGKLGIKSGEGFFKYTK